MAQNTGGKGVRIKVSADTAKARRDIQKLDKSFVKTGKSAEKTTRSIKRLAIGIGSAFSAGVAVHGINKTTSGFIELENQVALVTGRTDELAKQMDKLYSISLKTRAPMAGTAEIFSRMGRSLRDSGVSIDEINKAVVSLNKAATISGGSVQSQQAAFMQLGQGLAAGALRGQELNSVMEQLPRVSRAIADELGVGIGELRKMAEQGEITSEVVFGAMLNQTEAINSEFKNIKLSSTKAFALMSDQIGRLVADLSLALGLTDSFATAFIRVAEYLDGNRISIVNSVVNARDALKDFRKELSADIKVEGGFLGYTQKLFAGVSEMVERYMKPTEQYIKGWGQRVSGYFFKIYDEVIGHSWWTDTMKETYGLTLEYLPKAVEKVRDFANTIVGYFKDLYGSASGAIELKVSSAIGGISSMKKTMASAVESAVNKGMSGLFGFNGEIRTGLTTAIVAAFTFAFSTGSISKSLSKVANKIGPLFALSIGAYLLETIGSPTTIASFAILAGEFVGSIAGNIVSALPEAFAAAMVGIPTALIAYMKEAGLVGGTLFAAGMVLALSKNARAFTATIGNFFAGGFAGKGDKMFGGASKDMTLLQVRAGLLGDTLRQKVSPAFANLKAQVVPTAASIQVVGSAIVTKYTPVIQRATLSTTAFAASQSKLKAGLAETGSFLKRNAKTAAILGAAMLFAGDAFASTGDEVSESSGAMSTAISAGLTALLLFPAEITDAVKALGGKIGKLLGKTVVVTMARSMLVTIGTAIAGAVAAAVGSVALLVAGAVAAVVAVGGLAYVMFFGEGDTFLEKSKDTIKKVGRLFNLVGDGNFENQQSVRKRAREINARGQLGKFRSGSTQTLRGLESINFGALGDKQSHRIVSAIDELEKASNEFNQETLTYGQASLEATKALEKAQKETTAAVKAADRGQNAELAETLVSGISGRRDDDDTKDILRELARIDISTPKGLQDFASAAELTGQMEKFPQQIQDLLSKVALSPLEPSQNLTDAIGNAIQATGPDFNWWTNMANWAAISEAFTGAAAKNLLAAEGREGIEQFIISQQRLNDRTQQALERYGLEGKSNLASVDMGERVAIAETLEKLLSFTAARDDALAAQASAETEQEVTDATANVSLYQASVDQLEAQLESITSKSIERGFEFTNYNILSSKLEGLGIGEALAAEIGYGLGNGIGDVGDNAKGMFGIWQLADALDGINDQIEEIERGQVSWSNETALTLAQLKNTKGEYEDVLTNANAIADALDVRGSEVPDLLAEAASISGLNIDLDKLFKVDPAKAGEIAELAASVIALKIAAADGGEGGLMLAGAEGFEDALAQIETKTAAIKAAMGSITGIGYSGGGNTETPIEMILSRTGLALESLTDMASGEVKALHSALKNIEAAEKAINKSGLANVEMRRKQLEIIRQQETKIQDILLSGTVGQAEAGLGSMGISEEIVRYGPEAIALAIEISELERERLRVNVDGQEAINDKIRERQDLLDAITEKESDSAGEELYNSLSSSLSGGLAHALKTGDLKGAFHQFADSFTSTVIDTFSEGLVEALLGDNLKKAMRGLFSEDMFKGLADGIKGLFSGIGGGGGLGGLFSGIMGIFGFSQGGIVPSTSYSQAGKDSVPALLKPGERVVDYRKGGHDDGSRGQSTVVNLNVTGDISRQTRKEIMGMIPQIANGVNSQNKERGGRFA